MKYSDFFSDENFHRSLFQGRSLFDPLKMLESYLLDLTKGANSIAGRIADSARLSGAGIVIEEGAYVDHGASIQGPCIISRKAIIGHGALVRANTIVGTECVVGHCSEIKDSVMFPRTSAGHFNFIGDSILGSHVNIGGGTIISNFEFAAKKGMAHNVSIKVAGTTIETGLQKLGAIIGDNVKTGSNSVLSPGSLLARDAVVYPGVCVRKGFIGPSTLVKSDYYVKGADKL